MRCYFLNDGHIAGVEVLPPGLSDKDAIARARVLALKRKGRFDGFEIWHHNRMIFRLEAPASAETVVPVSRWAQRQLTDDGASRDALGPEWPWPVARH
jgi:hypothetical protein